MQEVRQGFDGAGEVIQRNCEFASHLIKPVEQLPMSQVRWKGVLQFISRNSSMNRMEKVQAA
jgi:hypothetical protein